MIKQAQSDLGREPIFKLILKFALPAVISLLVNAAYNLTDQIFIGHIVGIYGNAATNVAYPTMAFSLALAQLSGLGTASNFDIALGGGCRKDAKRYIANGVSFALILAVVWGAFVYLFKSQIIWFCGSTENVFPYANAYLSITAVGLPFYIFGQSMTYIIRADGSPKYSMASIVTGAVLNVFLDWLFMAELGWGIKGAAAATVIGQMTSVVFALVYFTKFFKSFDFSLKEISVHGSIIIHIVKNGLPNAINHTMMMVMSITLNNVLSKYGAQSEYGADIPLAVSGMVSKLQIIIAAFSVGIAQGCQPVFGYNLGAKNYSRVRETLLKGGAISLTIGLIFFILFQTCPREIIAIFGSGGEQYFQFAEKYLRIYMFLIISYSIQPLAINYFVGIGRVKEGTLVSIARQGLFLIPLLLIAPRFFGMNGILYSGPISDTLALTLSITLLVRNLKQLDRLDSAEKHSKTTV